MHFRDKEVAVILEQNVTIWSYRGGGARDGGWGGGQLTAAPGDGGLWWGPGALTRSGPLPEAV